MSTETTTNTAWLSSPPVKGDQQDMPEWYTAFQAASWERFQSLPVPSRSDEAWRYADLKKSRFETLQPAQSATAPSVEPAAFGEACARFVYVNGEASVAEVGDLPAGVVCQPIDQAIASGDERLKAYFDVEAKRLGDEKFAALNGAASIYGLYVYVPKGVELSGSISVQHYITGDSAPVFPRTLVVAEDNARVSIVETYESVDSDEPGLSIGVADFHADRGSQIQHVLVQNLNEHSKQVHLATSRSGRDSNVQTVVLNLGGAWVRNESLNYMLDSGADTQIFGANLANSHQEFDQRTLQVHDAQHTTSDLLIKNALYDTSRVIFGGLIQVRPGAHHTDSYQSCRNLLGSDQAEVNAMPGLEIDADQVKCSHGATSGQISDDEIFYLRSRGIPADDARRIVSCGFLNEALSKVTGSDLRDWLEGLIAKKFDQVS